MRYEIRAMSGAEILDTSFRLLRNHFALLIGITASVYFPLAVAGAAIQRAVERGPSDVSLTAIVTGGVVLITIATVGATIVFTAVTHAIAELYRGRPVTWSQALARAQRSFIPVVGTTMLSGILCLLGFLLVIPGIYLALSWVVMWPVMLIEQQFGMRALRRSRTLMRGNLLRAVGLLAVVWIISAVLSAGLSLPAAAVPTLHMLISGLTQAVTTTYGAIVTVILYFDVRCRKEAFDLEHLAGVVAGTEVGAPPTPA